MYDLSKTPIMLKKEDPRKLRKEYTRVRRLIQKRLNRLQGTIYEQSKFYRERQGRLEKLSQISDDDLPYKLADLYKLESGGTTKRAMSLDIKRKIKALESHEITFVNENNFFEFANFMEEYRNQGLEKMYASEQVALYLKSMLNNAVENPQFVERAFVEWKESNGTKYEL